MGLPKDLWATYLDRFSPVEGAQPPTMDFVGVGGLARLIWPVLEVFRPKLPIIEHSEVSEAFDAEADNALWALALTNTFDSWGGVSTGAWALLYDRAQWAMTALMIEDFAGTTSITLPLPRYAPPDVRAKAAFLFEIADIGKSPSDEWKKTRSQRDRGAFLNAPPWRH